jgi:ribosomal protein L12E/L44/L45/RPP1/RPP2
LEQEASDLRRENGWLKEIVMLKSRRPATGYLSAPGAMMASSSSASASASASAAAQAGGSKEQEEEEEEQDSDESEEVVETTKK